MNEVNQLAAASNASYLESVRTMLDIFGEVQANLAPAFGGQSIPIRNADDFAALTDLLFPPQQ